MSFCLLFGIRKKNSARVGTRSGARQRAAKNRLASASCAVALRGCGAATVLEFSTFGCCELDVFVPDPDAEAELSTGTRSSLELVDVAEFSAG